MRNNVWTIVFAVVTFALLAANAQEDNRRLDLSTGDSKLSAEFLNNPALSTYRRRPIRAIYSKLDLESESSAKHDSLLLRGTRSVDDNENNGTIATTSLPLENDDSTLKSDADSISPAQNAMIEEEVNSSPITPDDPETSDEKDKGAGDNDGIAHFDETTSAVLSITTPIPVESNDEVDNGSELEQADQVIPEAPIIENMPAVESSSTDADKNANDDDEIERAVPESRENLSSKDASTIVTSEHPSSEEDQSQSVSVIETSPSILASDVNGVSEGTVTEVSLTTSEVRKDEASVTSSTPTSEEQRPESEANTETQSLLSETDANSEVETSTFINQVDSTSGNTPPKTSSESEITENTEDTESNEDDDNNILKNEDIDEVTDEDIDDGPTHIAFDDSTEIPIDVETTTEKNNNELFVTSTFAPINSYDFKVYDQSTNIPCTLASMSITLQVNYATKEEKTRKKSLQVPTTASVSGYCGEKDANLTLSWPIGSGSFEQEDTITFTLRKDDSHFFIGNIQVSLVPNNEDFPNITDELLKGNSASDLRLFSAPLRSGAHVCRAMTEVTCGPIVAQIKDVSLIAYNDKKSVTDRKVEHCSPMPKSLSIAAIVGGVVGLTVTIGIVASYAWYRKRTGTFRSELP